MGAPNEKYDSISIEDDLEEFEDVMLLERELQGNKKSVVQRFKRYKIF